MFKLPFKTQPQGFEKIAIGTPQTGELEISKMSDLSPNERIFIKEELKDYPDLKSTAVKMAKSIASKSGQKLLDVFNALTSGNAEELGEYLEEFIEFQDLIDEVTSQRRLVMATAIIKYRVLPEWTIENSRDSNLIHPSLLKLIADFAIKEESGWDVESTPVTEEEDLGKSPPEVARIAQTGEKSTGESITTGEETKDLVLSGSASSQPG